MLEQADGTAWMALYCLSMLEIALVLAEHDRAYEDVAVKFFEHFALIAEAMNDRGLWDEEDGFYYDQCADLRRRRVWPLRASGRCGLLPLCAVATGSAADDGPTAGVHAVACDDFLRSVPSTRRRSQPGRRRRPT